MSTNPAPTAFSTTSPTQTSNIAPTQQAPPATTTTTTTTHHTPQNSNGGLANKTHSALAAVHGTGEAVRGHFNAAVDSAFHEGKGVERDSKVENEGLNEIASGHFGSGTKVREGAVPGDGGREGMRFRKG